MLTCTTHEAAVELGIEDDEVVMLAHQGKLQVTGDGLIDKASLLLLKSSGTEDSLRKLLANTRLQHLEASYGRL